MCEQKNFSVFFFQGLSMNFYRAIIPLLKSDTQSLKSFKSDSEIFRKYLLYGRYNWRTIWKIYKFGYQKLQSNTCR